MKRSRLSRGSSPVRKKRLNIIILSKKINPMGNPVYKIFFPSDEKIVGLRKLKEYGMYSFSSYNVGSYLKDYVFKGRSVNIDNKV